MPFPPVHFTFTSSLHFSAVLLSNGHAGRVAASGGAARLLDGRVGKLGEQRLARPRQVRVGEARARRNRGLVSVPAQLPHERRKLVQVLDAVHGCQQRPAGWRGTCVQVSGP